MLSKLKFCVSLALYILLIQALKIIQIYKIHCLQEVFFLFCLVVAIWRIFECFDNFMADESISSVQYKKYFDSPEDIYLALTLCFEKPFFRDKLEKCEVDQQNYLKLLKMKH